jgi:hypothetical protein
MGGDGMGADATRLSMSHGPSSMKMGDEMGRDETRLATSQSHRPSSSHAAAYGEAGSRELPSLESAIGAVASWECGISAAAARRPCAQWASSRRVRAIASVDAVNVPSAVVVPDVLVAGAAAVPSASPLSQRTRRAVSPVALLKWVLSAQSACLR